MCGGRREWIERRVATEGNEGEYEGKAEEYGREGTSRGEINEGNEGKSSERRAAVRAKSWHAVGRRRTHGETRVGMRADGETLTTKPRSARSCPSLRQDAPTLQCPHPSGSSRPYARAISRAPSPRLYPSSDAPALDFRVAASEIIPPLPVTDCHPVPLALDGPDIRRRPPRARLLVAPKGRDTHLLLRKLLRHLRRDRAFSGFYRTGYISIVRRILDT
jgi:hypothetical protein